jgi:mannose-6-phosphate isomerase
MEEEKMSESRVGPLVLEPILVERVWGASELPAPYPRPAAGKPVGEVWLTAETCMIEGGALDGRTLAEIAKEHVAVLGAEHGFPLLLKMLFPREKLSVQVHPDDAEAEVLGQPRGKTECWYVLDAEPGAAVAVGLREGVSRDAMRAAIADGSAEDKMNTVPVKAGDMVFVDAGTVHAIGPGMTVLETQQYSDVTYRLYDYGRPRELHVEQGLAVTKPVTKAGQVAPVRHADFVRLVQSDYFAVDRFELSAGDAKPLGDADKLQVLVALSEGVSVRSIDGEAEVRLPHGRAVVLPAEGVAYTLRAHGAATVVRVLEP